MKIEDLRIGNLVNFDGKHEFISSLHGDSTLRLKKTIDGDCHGCYGIRNKRIQPIPLTEEWLIKFCFEENEHGFYKLDFFGMSFLYKHNYGFSFCKNDIEIECYTDFTVHQLQNLYFALTNEELTIKL